MPVASTQGLFSQCSTSSASWAVAPGLREESLTVDEDSTLEEWTPREVEERRHGSMQCAEQAAPVEPSARNLNPCISDLSGGTYGDVHHRELSEVMRPC